MNLRLAIFSGLFFATISLYAQTPFFQRYNFTGKKENLHINKMVQDHEGYWWFGTTNGLYRFDGKNTVAYSQADSLPEKNVTALATDSAGRIWIGHENGAISYLEKGKIMQFVPPEGTSTERISDIIFDQNGLLWFSTHNDGLYYYKSNRLYRVDEAEGMPDLFVYDLAIDEQGNIIAGTDGGITTCSLRDNKVTIETIDSKQGLPDNIVRKVLISDKESLWIGTEDEGLIQYNRSTKTFTALLKDWTYGPVKDVILKGNVFWIATERGLVTFDRNSGKAVLLGASFGPEFHSVHAIDTDQEGNIWVGTSNGALRTPGLAITFVNEFRSHPSKNILAVTRDHAGKLWYSTKEGLFSGQTTNDGRFVSEARLRQTPSAKLTVISLFTDRYGFIWAGLYGEGVFKIDPSTGAVRHFTKELRNGNVLNISGKGDTIWLATLGGATRIVTTNGETKFRNFTREDGLSSDFIYHVYPDSKNRIWFSTDGKGIDMLDEEGFHHLESGLPAKVVYSVTEGRDGRIWANVQSNGLYVLNDSQQFEPSPIKIRSQELSVLASDDKGNIVVMHDQGIDIIDIIRNRVKYLGEESGLSDKTPNLNSVTGDRDGNLYFGTGSGIITYRDGQQFLDHLPQPGITQIKIFDKAVQPDEITSLSYDQNNLTFNFVGLWYQNPTNINFRYMLENYDREWLLTRDNMTTYSSLPPGDYVFRIQASESEDFAGAEEKKVAFTIHPPFWRTNLFYAVSAVLIVVVAYSAIKYRERKLRYNNMILEARVRVRTQEVQRQRDEIQTQNEEITAQAEEIRGINENLEALVRERTAELERKNKAIEEYAFINAHKLRSPVASILGLTNLMTKISLNNEGKEINERLQQAAGELDDIVRSITKAIEKGEIRYPIAKKNEENSDKG